MNDELTPSTSASPSTVSSSPRAFATPSVDIFETKEAFLLLAELPGVAAGDVEINLDKSELTLEARRSDQPLDFRRRFTLSVPVEGDRVSAKLEHGVLRIELPKAAAARPRTIPVLAS